MASAIRDLGDGVYRLELYWPDPDTGPYLLGITFDTVVDRLEIVGVEVWGRAPNAAGWVYASPAENPHAVTSTAIRLPLDRIATETLQRLQGASKVIARHPDVYSSERVRERGERLGKLEGASQTGRPPTYDRAHFEEVAAVYSDALTQHQNPTAAVAARFTVTKSTAAKWVARCRSDEFRLLPPTSRGRSAGARKS